MSLSGSPATKVIIFHLQVEHLHSSPSAAVICCPWEPTSSFGVRMETSYLGKGRAGNWIKKGCSHLRAMNFRITQKVHLHVRNAPRESEKTVIETSWTSWNSVDRGGAEKPQARVSALM